MYVALTHLNSITGAVKTFGGYFAPLALGGVLAYLINPLAALLSRTVFRGLKKEKLRWTLSIALGLLTVLLVLGFLLGTLIPQLVNSIITLLDNMDVYIAQLQEMAENTGILEAIDAGILVNSSEDLLKTIGSYLTQNAEAILSASATAGKGVVRWLIALILSVYLLSAKASIQSGVRRLLRAILGEKRLRAVVSFVSRCDGILIRYIVYSLLDALIVGTANAIFMVVLRMQYVGLVSMVVGVTNLIPTFGPVIGGVIGGFVLLLVKPLHALIFLGFTVVLQFLDGYVIKPKLFGNSLGVSGLLILTAVVVCGNMFGIIGILLAIPLAAILDFVYRDYFIPALENRQNKKADRETE